MSKKKDYWDSVRKRDGIEGVLANPDLLAAPEIIQSEELRAILEVIDDGGEKVLTKKQQKAFQLVVREGKSLRTAAKKMHCSHEMVNQFLKAGVVKLRKLTLTKLASEGY